MRRFVANEALVRRCSQGETAAIFVNGGGVRQLLVNIETGLPFFDRFFVPSYAFMLVVAFAVAFVLSRRQALDIGLDKVKITDLGVYLILFALVGARLAHVLFDGMLSDYVNLCFHPSRVAIPGLDHLVCHANADCRAGGVGAVCDLAGGHCHPARDCLAAFRFWQGGMTYYGGLLAALAFGSYYVRRHKMAWGKVLDVFGLLLPLGLAFGRVGCFLNGCCYGRVSHLPWAVRFPPGSFASYGQYQAGQLSSADVASLPVHPTQVYSALFNLAIFFWVLFVVSPKKRFHGQVMASFLLWYSVGRFLVEIFRADPRGGLWFLSTSQVISVLVGAVVGLWMLRRRSQGADQQGCQDVAPDMR